MTSRYQHNVRRRYFIRFGSLPEKFSAISEDYRRHVELITGCRVPFREGGVSVFDTYWSNVLNRWFVPETQGNAASLGELYVSRRPIFLLTGRVIGEGSDGEPLLRRSTINIVKKLTKKEIFVEGQGEDQLPKYLVLERLSERDRKEHAQAEVACNVLQKKLEMESDRNKRMKLFDEMYVNISRSSNLFMKAFNDLMNKVRQEARR